MEIPERDARNKSSKFAVFVETLVAIKRSAACVGKRLTRIFYPNNIVGF